MNPEKTIIAGFVITCLIFSGCTQKNKKEATIPKTYSSSVRVTGITPNDLGQIMIFTKDNEKNKILFIKDFYCKGKSQQLIRKEMITYMKKIKKYYCKDTEIVYTIDSAGQKNVCRITEIH